VTPKRKTHSRPHVKQQNEGLLVGMSSGAILHVTLRKAKELGNGKTILAILPSGGERYPSTPLYPE